MSRLLPGPRALYIPEHEAPENPDPGQCPRCGARPQRESKKIDKKADYRGTLFDRVSNEWSCLDCGCQFTDEGAVRSN